MLSRAAARAPVTTVAVLGKPKTVKQTVSGKVPTIPKDPKTGLTEGQQCE